jgi:GTPase
LLIGLFKKRLVEGRGETLYEIGYDGMHSLLPTVLNWALEQGSTMNLSEDELDVAYSTLVKVAAALEADCHLIHKALHVLGGWVGTVMMRKRADAVEALEIRVACTWRPSCNQLIFRRWKCRCWKEYTSRYVLFFWIY